MAVKAAKEKATDMAEAIGQKAGPAIHIQEIEYNNYPMMRSKTANIMLNVNEARDETVPEIEFEKIKLEYQVNAKFALN